MARNKKPRKRHLRWTEAETEQVRLRYSVERTADLAASLDRGVGAVYQHAAALGIKKSIDFIRADGRRRASLPDAPGTNYRFPKGLTPWNKGVNFIAGGRSVETQFKPGCLSGRAAARYQPIGAERLSKEGYLERKINDDMQTQKRWRAVHILTWEAVHGPLPKGHALVFRDGNKANIALENLEPITRAELMRRNSVHSMPPELEKLVLLRGALNRQINQRIKNEQ